MERGHPLVSSDKQQHPPSDIVSIFWDVRRGKEREKRLHSIWLGQSLFCEEDRAGVGAKSRSIGSESSDPRRVYKPSPTVRFPRSSSDVLLFRRHHHLPSCTSSHERIGQRTSRSLALPNGRRRVEDEGFLPQRSRGQQMERIFLNPLFILIISQLDGSPRRCQDQHDDFLSEEPTGRIS